jgi:hypothetical protein
MSLLQLAEDAVAFARAATPMGSNNKTYGQSAPVPLNKQAKNTPEKKAERYTIVNALKNVMPLPNCDMNQVIAHGHRVLKARAGNCMDQCSAALIHITWQLKGNPTPVDIVWLSPPGDHIFIAMGQPREGRVYPADFADWNAEAVICDPWAKIACMAHDYPDRWEAKMQKWLDRTMAVSGGNPKTITKEVVLRDKLSYMA